MPSNCLKARIHLCYKVSGRFFCPVNSGGIINLGLTPLHFAVSTGQAPAVQALLKQCGDSKQRHHLLWKRDSLGNTILHMCVTHNMQTMVDILMSCLGDLEKELQNTEWWHIKPRRSIADDDNLKNHDGHTVSNLKLIFTSPFNLKLGLTSCCSLWNMRPSKETSRLFVTLSNETES